MTLNIMQSIVMLSVVHAERHIQALYAECQWPECLGAIYLSVILNIKHKTSIRVLYSQHFIFFLTYEWVQ
jgi:hypothetical protein